MDEQLLQQVADELRHQVMLYGDRRGFYHSNLRDRCRRFANMTEPERFRTLVMLCRMPGIAVSIGPLHAWRFHPAHDAPADAVALGERREDKVWRAMERT